MKTPSLEASHIAHFIGLPLILVVERFAHYGSRSVLLLYLLDFRQMETDAAMQVYTTSAVVGIGAPLLGGLCAAIFGPYATLVAGSVLASAGLFGLWGLPDQVLPTIVVAALGTGLIRTAFWTLAAVQLTQPRQNARNAFFTLLYVLLNLAAMAGALVSVGFDFGVPPRSVFLTAAGLLLGVAAITSALWFFGRSQTWPEPDLPTGAQASGIAVAVLVLVTPFWLLMGVSGAASYTGLQTLGVAASSSGLFQAINPSMVVAGGVVAGGAWLAAHVVQSRVPDLVFVGIALIAAGLGAFAMHPIALGFVGTVGLGAGTIALALCEVLVIPVALSRVGGESHWRVAPLLIGAWTAASGAVGWAGDYGVQMLGLEGMLPLAAFVAGVSGVLLIVLGVLGRSVLVPEGSDAITP